MGQELPQPGHFSLLILQLHPSPGHQAEYLLKLWADRHMGRKADDYDFKPQAFRAIHCTSGVTGEAGIPNRGQLESSYSDWPLCGMTFLGNLLSCLCHPQLFPGPSISSSTINPGSCLLPGPWCLSVRAPRQCLTGIHAQEKLWY